MSSSVAATTQPSPYIAPAGQTTPRAQSAADQAGSDLNNLAAETAKAAKEQGTGVHLDVTA